MPQKQIALLISRSTECEILSRIAGDVSIRNKCAELATEYRDLAERLKAELEESDFCRSPEERTGPASRS